MIKIENIIFDLGGVVLTDEDVGFLFDNEEAKRLFNSRDEKMADAWKKNWRLGGEGKVTNLEFYNLLQKEIKDEFNEGWSKRFIRYYKERTRALESYYLLPKLKKKYNLYCLTNMTPWGFKFKKDKFKLDKYFKIIVSSSEEKISKPDPKIFKILIKKAKIKPSETLFIDDNERNTKAGEDLGFVVYKYEGIESMEKRFKELGILV